jgi:hypothetical protein
MIGPGRQFLFNHQSSDVIKRYSSQKPLMQLRILYGSIIQHDTALESAKHIYIFVAS